MIPAPHAIAAKPRCEHARILADAGHGEIDDERHYLAGECRVWCPACARWIWAGLYRSWPSPMRILAAAGPDRGWKPGP